MDIPIRKRKYVETRNDENSERNPDEILAKRDQLFIVGSTNGKNPQSTKIDEKNLTCKKLTSAKSGEKLVDHKSEDTDKSLVDRLRKIKQQRCLSSSAKISDLRDAQISDETFVESARVLDNACNSNPTTKKCKNVTRPLHLVPFAVLEHCDSKKQKLEISHRSIAHFSLEEDNEEDLFADAKEDTENFVDFSHWEYESNKSLDESFCGFSPGKIQYFRDIVQVQQSLLDKYEDDSDNGEDEALQGFSSEEKYTSQKLSNDGNCRMEKYFSNDSFGQDCSKKHPENTEKMTGDVLSPVETAVTLFDKSPMNIAEFAQYEGRDYCKSENIPESKSLPKLAAYSISTCGFSTACGRPISVSGAALKKAQSIYSEEISSIKDKSHDNCNSEVLPESKNSTKLATPGPSLCRFSTAARRSVNVSGATLKKAQSIYSEEISSIKDKSHDNCNSEGLPESKNSTKFASPAPSICGFSTASGRSIKISESAVIRAKRVYSELDDCEASSSTKKILKCRTEESIDRVNVGFGFSTARGNQLKISAAALSKAKALFDQDESIANITLPSTNNPSTSKSHDTGQSSSKVALNFATDLDNIESINFDDFVDPVGDNDELSRKRKVDEIDEETPLRRDAGLKQKRGRYVNDLQARKLFLEDSDNEDDAPTIKSHSELAKSEIRETDKSTVSPEKILISEEVVASAAALFEDEQRSNESSLWKNSASFSPRIETEPETVLLLPDKSITPNVTSTKNPQGINRSWPEASPSLNKTKTERNSLDIQPESIPDDLNFDTQFSQEIQYSPVMETFIDETMKIMEARLAMTRKQDEAIRAKRRTKPQQRDGFLYNLRISNRDSRISWKDLTKGAVPAPREISNTSLESEVLSVTSSSAESYRFRCADLFGSKYAEINAEGITVGDDAFLILDEKNRAGVSEFERAFLAMPGVDPNLVTSGWVRNHYRWIVWKLASIDRVDFGHKCLPRMLTPDRVMFELKYRYDREIYRTQWPPLRRILEKSEDPSARIVLCVASITITEESVNAPVRGANTPNLLGGTLYKMKLTDGWYCIDACIDAAMISCIKSGKVREGTKLMTMGAKTLNLDQGCSALEIPVDVSLRIHTNSTRRVRWNTKLDYYHANRGPMLLSLKSIKPNGGVICKLVVAVARLYPILYREKLPDGQLVYRNARCDEEAALAHESLLQSKMEEIYANARTEFQIGLANNKGNEKTRNRGGMEQMASSYREREEELRQWITSKLRECLPPPRDVTPVMKIRIAEDETSAMLTVWSNDRDTSEIFVEGSSIVIYNAFATGQRLNELHITAGRSSFFKRETTRRIIYPERIFTSLTDTAEPGFNPVYGEFDTIGIVSSMGPAPHGMKNFETVNLACPKASDSSESSFLSVLFWQGVSTHGCSKILTVGSLVACSNLQWRRNTVKSIPTAYWTERSIFSKNPRQIHLTEAFENLRVQIKEPFAYAAACAVIIEEEIAKKSALKTPGKGTPYKPATSNNLTPGWTPRDSRNSINANITPGIDSKKAAMKKRIEKLEAYGEPPKLPPIVINHSSHKVLSDFRSPVVTPVKKS